MPPVASSIPPQPPQTIMVLPVHTAVWPMRGDGVPAPTDVGVQRSAAGSYRAPVSSWVDPKDPPQTIISAPDHTAVASRRVEGSFTPEMGRQTSPAGS